MIKKKKICKEGGKPEVLGRAWGERGQYVLHTFVKSSKNKFH